MYLNAPQYRNVFDFILGRIRNIPYQSYLRYPDCFITCGGIPIVDFDLGNLKYDQDFEFFNGDYDFDSIESINYGHLPYDMTKTLLAQYRMFIDRFNLSLEHIFRAYQEYLSNTHSQVSGFVSSAMMEEIQKVLPFSFNSSKDIFIHPAPCKDIVSNASKTRFSWARNLDMLTSTKLSTKETDSWSFVAGIYTLLNARNILPLDPSVGLDLINGIETDDEIVLLTLLGDVGSTLSMVDCLAFTPEQWIELMTDISAACGLISTSESNILFSHQFLNARNLFQNNKIDLTLYINDFLDRPDTWGKQRKIHLSRALAKLNIIEEIDSFYKEANSILTILETQLQNAYIKQLEDDANKLVPPEIIEYHNQYSW